MEGISGRNEKAPHARARGSTIGSYNQYSDDNDSDASSPVISERSYSCRSSDNGAGSSSLQRHISGQSMDGITLSRRGRDESYISPSSPPHLQTQLFSGIAPSQKIGMPRMGTNTTAHHSPSSYKSSTSQARPQQFGTHSYDDHYFPRVTEPDSHYPARGVNHLNSAHLQQQYYTAQPGAMSHANIAYEWPQRTPNQIWMHSPQ